MAYTVIPVIGTDFNNIVNTNLNSAGTAVPTFGPLGTEVFGSDGRIYVLAQANATITASTTVCDINTTTFLVAATGGSYKSPAVALASGDVAWFSKASV
jgi:hypothetical protein